MPSIGDTVKVIDSPAGGTYIQSILGDCCRYGVIERIVGAEFYVRMFGSGTIERPFVIDTLIEELQVVEPLGMDAR